MDTSRSSEHTFEDVEAVSDTPSDSNQHDNHTQATDTQCNVSEKHDLEDNDVSMQDSDMHTPRHLTADFRTTYGLSPRENTYDDPKPDICSVRRLDGELTRYSRDGVGEQVDAAPANDELYHWEATIIGPSATPYEGGLFYLDVRFPADYPMKPPWIVFKTKVYHPNIDGEGRISIDALGANWCPVWQLRTLLLAICSLLDSPNPDDPLMPEIAAQYLTNRQRYDVTAREWTKKYAM